MLKRKKRLILSLPDCLTHWPQAGVCQLGLYALHRLTKVNFGTAYRLTTNSTTSSATPFENCLVNKRLIDFNVFFCKEGRNPFDYTNRHSSDALDRGAVTVLELSPFHSATSMEMTQFERSKPQYHHHHPTHQQILIQRTISSDVTSDDQVMT